MGNNPIGCYNTVHTVTVCSQISTLREQYNVWQLHLMLYTLISSDRGGVACTKFISICICICDGEEKWILNRNYDHPALLHEDPLTLHLSRGTLFR